MRTSLSGLMLIAFAAAVTAQPKPQLPPPPAVQLPPAPAVNVEGFFSNLRQRVIDGANQLDGWSNDAATAGAKKATDFASCPSPDAQRTYDDLKTRRDKAIGTRNSAQQAENDANAAFENCRRTLGDAACRVGYNSLPFSATKARAQATIEALNRALDGLKGMRCVGGCNRTASLTEPTVQVGQGEPVTPSAEVCTAWDPGLFNVSATAANGELSADMRARLPKCARSQRIAAEVCTAWDVKGTLAQLVKVSVVPPGINPGNAKIDVPVANVRVVSGFSSACSKHERVCTRLKGNVAINFDSANPLAALRSVGEANCAESTTLGCNQPPLGITPQWSDIPVPDLAHARLTWAAGSSSAELQPGAQRVRADVKPTDVIKPGSITVDLGQPSLRGACTRWEPVKIPTPRLTFGAHTVNTGICVEPRTVALVANP